MNKEHYHLQWYDASNHHVDKFVNLINENSELLYQDYAARMARPISVLSPSISEKQAAEMLAERMVAETGYSPKKDGNDPVKSTFRLSILSALSRTKMAIQRSQCNPEFGDKLLFNLEKNFEEITDTTEYRSLDKANSYDEFIRKILNNKTRMAIIRELKIHNGFVSEKELFSKLLVFGFESKDISTELFKLCRGGLIKKKWDFFELIDTRI